jgi:hypothetical protein
MARTRQPQGFVRVAPQFSGGSAAICTTILAPNLVTGELPTLAGNTYAPSIVVGQEGLALATANGDYIKAPAYSGSKFTTNFTIVVCASVPNLSAVRALIDEDDYPTIRKYQFRTETDGRILAIPFNGGGSSAFVYSSNTVTAGVQFVAAMRYADTTDVWLNGIGGTPVAVSGGVTTATTSVTIGGSLSGGANDCVDGGASIYGWVIVPRLLADAELRAITQKPAAFWGGVFPSQRRLWVQLGPAAGGATVTGTSASTLDAVTGTADADLTLAATSAATVSAVTGAADAAVVVAATSSVTVGTTTGTTDADVIVTATSAQTLDAVTGTASGVVISGIAGDSAATLGATTGAADAGILVAATSSATLGVTGASAGAVALVGVSAQTVNDVTGTAIGTTTGAAAGDSAATVGSVTGTAAGYVDVLGTSSATLGVTGTASGVVEAGPATGTSSATLAALSGTAAAQIIVAGSSVGQLGGVVGPDAARITSVDPRYLARARGRRFTVNARGRVFTART